MQCVGPLHTVVPPTFTELRRRGPGVYARTGSPPSTNQPWQRNSRVTSN
jgi:hypothetical protein